MIESLKVWLLSLLSVYLSPPVCPRCLSPLACSNLRAVQVCDVKHADLHQLQWMLSERSACPRPPPPRLCPLSADRTAAGACVLACREEEVLCLQHSAKQQQLQVLTQQEQLLELRAENRQVSLSLSLPPSPSDILTLLSLSLSLSPAAPHSGGGGPQAHPAAALSHEAHTAGTEKPHALVFASRTSFISDPQIFLRCVRARVCVHASIAGGDFYERRPADQADHYSCRGGD